MRYFVTGATGFIGSELVRQLREAGHQVTALARDPRRAARLEHMGVHLVRGELTNPDSVRDGMRGADGVFHVAGWYRIGDRDTGAAWTVNVEGTRRVLEAMSTLGIPKGVYTSTLGVYSDTHGRMVDEDDRYAGPWLSTYELTKWSAHFEVAEPMQRRGLPLVIVQPGAVYGPGDSSPIGVALEAAATGRLPMVPAVTAYCWGHVVDTAHAHLLAMERGTPGRNYIIAGPQHTLLDAVRKVAQLRQVNGPRVVMPPGVVRALAAALQRAERLPGWPALPAEYTAEYLRVAAGATYLGSNARAVRELGFAPRPLAEGLAEVYG